MEWEELIESLIIKAIMELQHFWT